MLADKRLILTGIVTNDLIAYAVAERARLRRAQILITACPLDRALTKAAAANLPRSAEIVDLDVTRDGEVDQLIERVKRSWGALRELLAVRFGSPPELRDPADGDSLELTIAA